MRLRYVPIAKELIAQHPELIVDHQRDQVLDVETLFSNDAPIHIEIGMGKGKFIYELAKENPHINYIGIEKFDSVIVRALEKLIAEPLANVMLLRADATNTSLLFQTNSISKLYLNFSDPWPKERHAKRRLTSRRFLKEYQRFLKSDATIEFKTDNEALFDYSVEEMSNYPMDIFFVTRDLHQEKMGNIMTEFEEKFSERGNKIYKLSASFMKEEQ